jgi:hypothetical protein
MMLPGARERRRPTHPSVSLWHVAVLLCASAACSTVEPGAQLSIAEVSYDESFFYCQVEPSVLVGQSCSGGDPARGESPSGCHASVTSFTIRATTGVACNGLVPSGAIPSGSRDNFAASQSEMAVDVTSAPMLTRPTQETAHPRAIFSTSSAEAEIIRQWAKTATR